MTTLQNKVQELKKLSWDEVKKLNFNQLKNNSDRDVKKLKKSILNRGFFSPFMIWNAFVFDGTGRLQALQELEKEGVEIPDLPCLFVEANNLAEAKIYALQMSSKHGEITQESLYEFTVDIPEVKTLVDEVDFYEFNMEFGEVEELETEAKEDDFDTTPPEQAKTVLGDLYEIGEHRLLCGDSTCSDTVAKLMNGDKADMVFTDPPYNVNAQSRSKKRGLDVIKNDNMFDEDFVGFIFLTFKNLFDYSKENIAFYIWHNHKCQFIFEEQLIENDFEIKSQIIWVKDIPSYSNNLFRQQHEIAFYCVKKGKEIAEENGKDSTIWNIPSVQSAKSFDEFGQSWFKGGSANLNLHVTQKPIQLPTKALNFNSEINNIILDLFLGSGSTMVASHQLKRKCYGMELDPKYCDVIVKRMLKLDPELTVKRNGIDVSKEFTN